MTHVLILHKNYNVGEITLYRLMLERYEYEVTTENGTHNTYLKIANTHQPDCIFFVGLPETIMADSEGIIELLQHYPLVLFCFTDIPELKTLIAEATTLQPFVSFRKPMLHQQLIHGVEDVLEK